MEELDAELDAYMMSSLDEYKKSMTIVVDEEPTDANRPPPYPIGTFVMVSFKVTDCVDGADVGFAKILKYGYGNTEVMKYEEFDFDWNKGLNSDSFGTHCIVRSFENEDEAKECARVIGKASDTIKLMLNVGYLLQETLSDALKEQSVYLESIIDLSEKLGDKVNDKIKHHGALIKMFTTVSKAAD